MAWYFIVMISAASALLAGHALRRTLRWAGERGWVYNTYNPRPPGAGTSGQVASIFQPAIQHVVDEQTSQRILATQDALGDAPQGHAAPAPADASPVNDLVYVPVGTDRFRAQIIAEDCRVEGIEVELLTSDDNGTGPEMTLVQRHRLLVRRSDLPTVQAIIDRGAAEEPR